MLRNPCRLSAWLLLASVTAPCVADRPWAEAMQRFERSDADAAPNDGGIVFVGSSSIRLWDLEASFGEDSATPLRGPLVNRGFGGSQIADSVREIDLLVLKHQPRQVVLYAGDNDIAAGKSAETVAADFDRFVAAIHAESPTTPIAFIAIKPSIKRRVLADIMDDANERVRVRCEADPRLAYVDIWSPMLGAEGEPRPELFVEDGLHLSKTGYKLWADEVHAVLAGSR